MSDESKRPDIVKPKPAPPSRRLARGTPSTLRKSGVLALWVDSLARMMSVESVGAQVGCARARLRGLALPPRDGGTLLASEGRPLAYLAPKNARISAPSSLALFPARLV